MSPRIQYQTFQHWANGLLSVRAEKQTRMTQTRAHFLIPSLRINGGFKSVQGCACVHACVHACVVTEQRNIQQEDDWQSWITYWHVFILKEQLQLITGWPEKILHVAWQSHHDPLLWCTFYRAARIVSQARRLTDVGWLYNTVSILSHQCCTLYFHPCFTDLSSERIIMMCVVCTSPSWYRSKDGISAHTHAYVWGEDNKSKCFVKLCNHTCPPSFICSQIRSGCVALSCIYSSTLPLCPFPLPSDGVLTPIRGPASFPHKSSSNGEHFVRWPDSSLPPVGRRCHPHGTEEQMLAKGKKRGEWNERKMEGSDLCNTRDGKHLFAHAKTLSGWNTWTPHAGKHATKHLQWKSRAAVVFER